MDFNRAIKLFRLLFVLLFLRAVEFALAEGAADINVSIPNVPSVQNNPGAWVGGFYQFSLMIAGLLAFGMIVYAGLRYTFAAGNPSTQSDARDQILQALLGVLLLLGAFIVLTTINPNLINLQLPGLGKVQNQPAASQSSGGTQRPARIGATGALTDAEARLNLVSGIVVKDGVSLERTHSATINAINDLKNNCDLCRITITAGTDGIHDTTNSPLINHANGYKVDLRSDPALNNYVTQNFTPIPDRVETDRSHTPQWQAPNGAIYAREPAVRNPTTGVVQPAHWDVLVKS